MCLKIKSCWHHMKYLNKYVPTLDKEDGTKEHGEVLVNGDQLSVSRMIQAKFNMASSL